MFSPEFYDKQADYIGSLHEALDIAANNGQDQPLDPNSVLRVCLSCMKPQLFLGTVQNDPTTPTRSLNFEESAEDGGKSVKSSTKGGTYVTAVMNTLLTTRSPNSKYSDSSHSECDDRVDLNRSEPVAFSPKQNFLKRRPSMRAERSMLTSSRARKYRSPGFQASPIPFRSRLSTSAAAIRTVAVEDKYNEQQAHEEPGTSMGRSNESTSIVDSGRKRVISHEMYYSLSPLLLDGSLSSHDERTAPVLKNSSKSISTKSTKQKEQAESSSLNDSSKLLELEDLQDRVDSPKHDDISEASTASSSGTHPEYFSVIRKCGQLNRVDSHRRPKPDLETHMEDRIVFHDTKHVCATHAHRGDLVEIKCSARSSDSLNVSSVSVTAQRPLSTPICSGISSNLMQSINSQAEPGLLSFSNVFEIGDVHDYDNTDELGLEITGGSDFLMEGYCSCSFCNNNEDMFTSTQGDVDAKAHSTSIRSPGIHCKKPDPHLYDPPLFRDDLSPTPEEKRDIERSPQYKEVLNLFCQCDNNENLQGDIEKHSTGVASVLNLCEVLLHDDDACGTDSDKESIKDATQSLDRRWRNICALSMERRLKIEDTQRLWQKFLADFARFSDWLKSCEETAAQPRSYLVSYSVAREELRSYENFQRQVHEGLSQLELINKQYRRLARENRTDASNQLRLMVYDGNTRWDSLSRRISCVLRRLKHAIERREIFETQRELMLVWLTEMDLKLTNLEHFSPTIDNAGKLKQIQIFKKRIDEHIPMLRKMDERGELLIQGGDNRDCVQVEEELREFHEYCSQVFIRLDRYYRRILRLSNDSDYKTSLYHDLEMREISWWAGKNMDASSDVGSVGSSPDATSPLPSKRSKKHSGRLTPGSMDSLEWDDYDISQSEIETKLASGEMTDDDSIPELSPFETRDAQIPTNQTEALLHTEPKSPQTEKPTKRTNVVDIRDLDTDARLKKPRTSDKMSEPQRQQLNNDLNDVLAWLDKVKCDLTAVCDCVTMRELELSLAELKELQKQIESRNPIVKSIRILATPLSRNDGEMKTKLHRLEQGWDRVNNSANQWRETLQSCFSDSKALRTDVAKIRERSTHLDQQREDLASVVKTFDSPLSIPLATLRKTHKDLVQIRFEVLEDRAQVASLQEMSHQLFRVDARYRGASSPPVDAAADTCDKLNDLGGRLRALLDRVTDDIHVAESALQRERHRVRDEASSNSDLDSLTSESSLRSATPIKLKMLRRKEETNEAERLEETKSKVVSSPMDADVIMTLPMQARTRNIAEYAEPDLQILHHETTSKSTENTYASFSNEPADSDVESGYVEYDVECEMQLVRHAVTTAFQSVTHLDEKHIEPDIDEQLRSISGLNANQNVSATKANIFWRVVKASVPFYIFFFFIYFLLWLSSASCIIDDRTICLQRNNLHYSFTPLLTWTDGPPPT